AALARPEAASAALARPEAASRAPSAAPDAAAAPPRAAGPAAPAESDQDFEARTTEQYRFASDAGEADLELPGGTTDVSLAGPVEAIRIYRQILEEYPWYEHNDQVLYQMARAYDEVGQPDDAMAVMERLAAEYPQSGYLDEVHFRRGEYLFTRRQFRQAEEAYLAIIGMGTASPYHELALYKLGWSFYKQDLYEEALHQFMALLDYKLSVGYDFDQAHEEDDERRVADTFRVISLGFSNLGGPEVVSEYYGAYGHRSYEDRIYSNLGEFYLSKLRYNDAAETYTSFVELNPYHRVAPRFSMRVVEIYGEGGFPLLVVESKKDFATKYGLQAEYWHYFDTAESPEVLGFLKTNLTDLANHYHALYQDPALEEERLENYGEASRWYREFLASFPAEPESPGINYQLADLLLEHQSFGEAAREYERTAYEYAPHEQSSAAGYAAIYAHRENLKVVTGAAETEAMRATIDSSLRFADAFPEHEHAPVVLGAAADDLYGINEFERAIEAARLLIERYPGADPSLRRSAWTVVAHGSFDLALYADAEHAYGQVLALVPEDDEARASLIDNLAASIYQQGEQANRNEDYRAAADHFLRIKSAAPTSQIRAAAEYDAAAALVRLEDWAMAADVLEGFRQAFPDHELQPEATKQLASVYRKAGQLGRSAGEYERVAAESADPELRREAMLLAGELYEEAGQADSALDVYARYIGEFPRPLDVAQETRFKVAGMYDRRGDTASYHAMLRDIVANDDTAGADRTDRSRYLAAQSALVLSEQLYEDFVVVELVQPFDASLAEKQRRMDAAMQAFEALVDYEVGEVTAAATFYIAEVYFEFSRSLLESERPADLDPQALVDYDLAIEEEAFPFEEQAIEVHEQNYELIAAGLYNPWVQRSLDRLADMMPGRYAKHEISTGFLDSIDIYAYRSPAAPEIYLGDGSSDDARRTEEEGVPRSEPSARRGNEPLTDAAAAALAGVGETGSGGR
ncbi:MAG: tetratricopeptide repeat protein, partial [Gammaproteobacteria bacterium]|nr:tetratricopeptide repeat protein [Gammaproteobacteria bacterium]